MKKVFGLMIAILFVASACSMVSVKCDEYDAGSGGGKSEARWSKCSDGKEYKVECISELDEEACACMVGDKKGDEFKAAFGKEMEDGKKKIVNDKCGWKIR